ncbi:MAG: hypothetical protein LQ346_005043 [Caloplaca aetnensis]|nr:MAG: hypothetical protein LQ346_005043 [Caloplaca aetnensis]
MAPSLASLPPELLREIIGSLFDNSDLLNLGLCCRSFYAAILPFLYAHVTFLRARAAEDLRSGPHLHLKELTARFQKEPELASFVQAITFLEGWIKDGEISCNEDQLVVKLLQALPNLKLLDFMSPNFGSDLDSAVFRVAIPKFRLAEGIDYWVFPEWIGQGWAAKYESISPVSSLGGFDMLKHLKIGMFVIFGAATWESHLNHEEVSTDARELPKLERLLPQGLQTIFFTHTQGRIGLLVDALVNMLRSKSACVPRLQEISFEAHLEGNKHAPSLMELGELAVANKVMLRAIDLPVDEDRGYDYDYEDFQIPDIKMGVGFWPGVTSSEGFARTWTQGSDFIWRPKYDDMQDIFDEGELDGAEHA